MNVVILCKAVCITIREVVNKSGKHVGCVHLSEGLVQVVDQWMNLVDGVMVWLPTWTPHGGVVHMESGQDVHELVPGIKELQNCCENSTTLSRLTMCFQGRQ